MRISIFTNTLGSSYGGPETVDTHMIRALARLDDTNEYTTYCISDKGAAIAHMNKPNFTARVVWPKNKWLSIPIGLPIELLRRPADLVHATYVSPPVMPCPFVWTVTCWSPYTHPEFYSRTVLWRLLYLSKLAIRNADAVFCYSEYLRQQLIEDFKYDPDRAFVTRLGIDTQQFYRIEDREQVRDFIRAKGIRDPFILFVGKLIKRKNVTRVIQAYDLLRRHKQITHKLVLLGGFTWTSEDIRPLVAKLKLEEHVLFLPPCPLGELTWYYNAADILVFPTLSEGWGYPPLEAMACGTPAVTSNVTSLPEVVGDGALLVDPYNVEELADAMYSALTDQKLRQQLIERGLRRARELTWDDMGRSVLNAYKTVYENRRSRRPAVVVGK